MILKYNVSKQRRFFNNRSNLRKKRKNEYNINVEHKEVSIQSAEDFVLCGGNK